MHELEVDTKKWSDVCNGIAALGKDATVALASGPGNEVIIMGSSHTGLIRVEYTIGSTDEMPDTPCVLVLPSKLFRASSDAIDPVVEFDWTGTHVFIRSGATTWTGDVMSGGINGIPRLAGYGTPLKLDGLLAAVKPLLRGVDGNKEQLPFRHVVVSATGSVAGVSGGRLLVRGQGWTDAPGIIRLETGVVRALSRHGTDASVHVGASTLLASEPGHQTWVSTWGDVLPIERFIDGTALNGLVPHVCYRAGISGEEMCRAITDVSASSETVTITGQLDGVVFESASCRVEAQGVSDLTPEPIVVSSKSLGACRSMIQRAEIVDLAWNTQFLMFFTPGITGFILCQQRSNS